MAKFDNAKVGDRVFSIQYGLGIIDRFVTVNDHEAFKVDFDNGDYEWYFKDGRVNVDDVNPTLFWNEVSIPTEEEDKKPFDLIEFLRENLKPKEFEQGKSNRYISYEYDLKEFEYYADYHSEDIGTVYIEELDDYYKTISELTINKVTPKQLKQAYKTLGWI